MNLPDLTAAIKTAEGKHRLPVTDNRVKPTVEFLTDLAQAIDTTPTGAYMAWVIVCEYHAAVGEREQQNAELAFWYSVDPYTLTTKQRDGLLANLSRVKAQRTLHEGNYDPCDWRGVYQLALLAFDDERLALEYRAAAIEANMNTRKEGWQHG